MGHPMVRLEDGRWYSALCGIAVPGVPETVQPQAEIRSASGKPTVRVLLVDGEEVHRCEPDTNRTRRSGASE